MRTLVVCSIVFVCTCVGAQNSGPAFAGAGFSNPFPLPTAAGGLLTLYIQPGAGYDPSAPLPSTSAVFWNGSASQPMPVVQINQTNGACDVPSNSGCTPLLAVTVQVPFDVAIAPPVGSDVIAAPSSIAVSINGVPTPYFGVQPFENHVHILNSCDLIAGGSAGFPISGVLPCPPMVVHADGKQVSAILPAVAGEELIAYATGLGQTNPALTAGQPAAQSSPTLAQFSLDFNYRPNALATAPGAVGAAVVQPLFTGATQGFVGLYQVNFIVPTPPVGIQPCVDYGVMPLAGSTGYPVQSNLTVSVGSNVSFDGAGICVQPVPVLDNPLP
jgi:hypothetical protein